MEPSARDWARGLEPDLATSMLWDLGYQNPNCGDGVRNAAALSH